MSINDTASETPQVRIDEFLKWVRGFGSKNMLYRGLSNSKHAVTSSILRRFPEKHHADISHEFFITKTAALVSDARMRRHDSKNGRELKDLEILAELQHYDAATCLFDFTRNPLVALWFACQPISGEEDSNCGKVIALDMDDTNLCVRINDPEQLKKDIRKLLSFGDDKDRKNNDMICIWTPNHQNERITAQQSVFVFGKPQINDYHDKIEILKDGMLEELQKLGISENFLFCDFHGFARNNAQNKVYKYSYEDYYEMAKENFQKRNYDTALGYYNEAIRIKPQSAEALYNRGHTKSILGIYQGAIEDLDKAIHINSEFADAFYFRGNAKGNLGDYHGAIEDLDKAGRIDPRDAFVFYSRGKINIRLKKYQEAINDFDKSIRILPRFTHAFNERGNAKASLKNYQEAFNDFDKAIRTFPQFVESIVGRGYCKFQLGDSDGARADMKEAKRLNPEFEIPEWVNLL